MLKHVNLMLMPDGNVRLAPASLAHGYSRDNPIIRVVGIPPMISADQVISAYTRCVVLPVMHAEIPVPWHRIADVETGAVIRLNRGRPTLSAGDKAVRINITLSPAALGILDARGGGRSQEIERLIIDSSILDKH